MNILLTGATGQLGQCLMARANRLGHKVTALSRSDCDLSQPSMLADIFSRVKPDLVINAAAYTAVDKAETEAEIAFAVNAEAVAQLAMLCQKYECPLIHVSTDYVFDGLATSPYQPDDKTGPTSVYGTSKLAGEQAVCRHTSAYLIIRTSWVFSEYGQNFVKTMRRLMTSRDQLSVVSDQLGRPTYAGDLADFILHAVARIEAGSCPWGTYHFSNATTLSWYQFALMIKDALVKAGCSIDTSVSPITTADYPTPARRPAFSVLDCQSTEQAFDYPMPLLAPALATVCKLLNDY